MPQHKRQHFLAQQQIRRWSKTGKSVRVLDKKIPKIIKRLSIKNTGQQDHYYEKQPVGVEAALARLEAQMKKATDRIHEKQELPTLEDEDRFTLMAYATTQLVRKEQTAGPARKALRKIAQDTLKIFEKGERSRASRPARCSGMRRSGRGRRRLESRPSVGRHKEAHSSSGQTIPGRNARTDTVARGRAGPLTADEQPWAAAQTLAVGSR